MSFKFAYEPWHIAILTCLKVSSPKFVIATKYIRNPEARLGVFLLPRELSWEEII